MIIDNIYILKMKKSLSTNAPEKKKIIQHWISIWLFNYKYQSDGSCESEII